MKAIQYDKFKGPLTVVEVPDPKPSLDGAVIEVKATGLCKSDWHGWQGHDADICCFPHIPGHEFSGVIVEVGKGVKNAHVGDRVTVPFVCGCGECEQCCLGMHHICDNQTQPGFTHWGSFANYVEVFHADTNVVKLPDEIDFVSAATLGCRFTTAYRAVMSQGKIRQGEWISIYGCGGVGLSAVVVAALAGANIIAIDVDDTKLSVARSLGAHYVIDATLEADVADAVIELSKGGTHLSIDAVGNRRVLVNSIRSLRKSGRHVQVGLFSNEEKNQTVPLDLVVSKELELIGSHGIQASKFTEIFDVIKNQENVLHNIVATTISIDEVCYHLPMMDTYDDKSAGVIVINRFN
ncbi:MAG: alcohol dehydrogenase [Gammaproteobacteria bacterium]|nr:alcohol dehydrogenase [Gammaproteobacteria bacterium]